MAPETQLFCQGATLGDTPPGSMMMAVLYILVSLAVLIRPNFGGLGLSTTRGMIEIYLSVYHFFGENVS